MVEKTRREGDRVWIEDDPRERQNICAKGEDLSVGKVVYEPGRRLRPVDLSVLAAVGCDPVPVFRRPRVSILTTGDELIAPGEVPGPGQIREGNTLHLAAMATDAGAEVVAVGLIADDLDTLAGAFEEALGGCDALITTGGVSMGKYDLVGAALERVGVEQLFHKIAIKPGKPVWFGRRGEALVFGLPGNPVSCLVTHEIFVRPALARIGGCEDEVGERLAHGIWRGADPRTNPRQQNLPVRVEQADDGTTELRSVEWHSSADVVALTTAQGLMVIPPNEQVRTGDLVRYRPMA
jgi:molybdopterin molybdotransferase